MFVRKPRMFLNHIMLLFKASFPPSLQTPRAFWNADKILHTLFSWPPPALSDWEVKVGSQAAERKPAERLAPSLRRNLICLGPDTSELLHRLS